MTYPRDAAEVIRLRSTVIKSLLGLNSHRITAHRAWDEDLPPEGLHRLYMAFEDMHTSIRDGLAALDELHDHAEAVAIDWQNEHRDGECDDGPDGVECTRDHATEADEEWSERLLDMQRDGA